MVALGGGAILRDENRSLLRGRTVVHLMASPETAAAHVGDGTGRPLVAPEADSDTTEDALHVARGRRVRIPTRPVGILRFWRGCRLSTTSVRLYADAPH